jgi:hypothetical protein
VDDILLYYAAIFAALFLGLTLLTCILLDIRAQAEERKELNRLLIMALFRMSKDQIKTLEDQTRHADAVGIALLRALRGGNASPALLAEVRREMEQPRTLPQGGEAPPAELPPATTDTPEPEE